MKKSILFAAAAVLATLTGCQKEMLLTPESMLAVNFGAQKVGMSSETKAGGLLESSVFPQTWDFRVSAYDYIGSSGRNDCVINADSVSYSSSSSKWVASGAPYYWPAGNVDKSGNEINTDLKMVAYAPATKLPGTFTYASIPVISKTGVAGTLSVNEKPADQVDFLYSSPKDFSKGNNVNLLFKHGMTNVVFKAKSTSDPSSTEIQIVSIKLNNVFSQGSFVTTDTIVWTPSSAKAYVINKTTHSSASFTEANVSNYSGGLVLTDSYQQFGDKMIFIPQSLQQVSGATPRGAVSADVTLMINKIVYYYKNVTLTSFADAITTWKPGKRVTYNISVGLNEIIFDAPSVTDWVNEAQTEKSF